MDHDTVLDEITRFYLESGDFNGIHSTNLSNRLGVGFNEFCNFIRELISERKVGILYSPPFGNPHIIQIGFKSDGEQIERLNNLDKEPFCLYPRPAHLNKVVNCSDYANEPYKLELALGCPQLDFRSFDPSVLEHYRNDPRYMYETDDISGHICYDSENMAERDKTMLESFGFSYNAGDNRAVAVFLRYLVRLSPEHQQIWKAKELEAEYVLHPDYYRKAILGDWREHESIFKAFLDELHLICQMTTAMGRPSLFREDYGNERDSRLKKFSFLIRPTLEEFNDFVHLLDKMISENINKAFFQDEVPYKTEIKRKDGYPEPQQKGTLQILDDWMRKSFRTNDWQSWDIAIKAFRNVRKTRQKPAHDIDRDVFDQKYFKEQRELMIGVYNGMRILRMIFENHPMVRSSVIGVPEYLQEVNIWTH